MFQPTHNTSTHIAPCTHTTSSLSSKGSQQIHQYSNPHTTVYHQTSTQAHPSTLANSHTRDCLPNTHKQANTGYEFIHTHTHQHTHNDTPAHTSQQTHGHTVLLEKFQTESRGLAEGLPGSLLMAAQAEKPYSLSFLMHCPQVWHISSQWCGLMPYPRSLIIALRFSLSVMRRGLCK